MWDEVERRDAGARAPDLEGEIDEELRFHIDGRTEELVAAGWDPEEARARALEQFGDVGRAAARSRRVRRRLRRRRVVAAWWSGLAGDATLALRSVTRRRRLSAAVVVILALGFGFATALFSVVDRVLLTPLPYPEADRLVHIWHADRATGSERERLGSEDFYDFADRTRSFEALSTFRWRTASLLSDDGPPRHINVAEAHHDILDVLGTPPALGRGFTPEDTRPGAPPTVLLTHRLWQEAFQGDRGIVGRTVDLDGVATEVLGVLPPRVQMAMGGGIGMVRALGLSRGEASRDPHYFYVVGRLADGVSRERAEAEVRALGRRMQDEDPANADRVAWTQPLEAYLKGPAGPTLWALLGATGLLLLVGCLNVMNLLVTRSLEQAGDEAVHRAMGASRGRRVRRNVLATLILSGGGFLGGLGVAALAVHVLRALTPPALLLGTTPGLHPGPVAVTGLLAIAIGVVLGAGPAAVAAGGTGTPHTRGGRRATAGPWLRRLQDGLVGVQAATAALLVSGALFMVLSLWNLSRVDTGFETEGTLHLTFVLPTSRYPAGFRSYPRLEERLQLQREMLRAGAEIAGVTGTALALNHSMERGFTNGIAIEGGPEVQGEPRLRMVTPDYFAVAGVGLRDGRLFTADDDLEAPNVVLVNEELAHRYFPDGDAVGRRIGFWGLGFREIVGVVANERFAGPRREIEPAYYTPLAQTPPLGDELTLLLRTAPPPATLAAAAREAVWGVDPNLAIQQVSTMEATMARALQRERFTSTVLATFAGMALLLAGIGVAAVLAVAVARRRRELGVRMALGARPGEMRRSVFIRALVVVLPASAGGLGLGWLLVHRLEPLLFGIDAAAPLPWLIALAIVAAAASLGAAVPAHRAARVSPAAALRAE
jgi:predicted permease